MILLEIRGKTISYSAWKKKESNRTEENLEKEINAIFKRVSEGENNLNNTLKEKKTNFGKLEKQRWMGYLLGRKQDGWKMERNTLTSLDENN